MKRYLIILLLISCETLLSQEINTVKVFYNKHMKSLKDTTKSNPKQLKDLTYVLNANLSESSFTFEKKMDVDNFSNKRFIGRSGGEGVYYKNLQTKEKLHQKEYGSKEFLISHDFNRFDWVIYKEHKMIGDYKCYKATTSYSFYSKLVDDTFKVNIVAWFTPEISIPFGPAGYDGLPGLVLEAQIGGFYFVASKIEINPDDLIVNKPIGGKEVSNIEYEKIVQKAIESKHD